MHDSDPEANPDYDAVLEALNFNVEGEDAGCDAEPAVPENANANHDLAEAAPVDLQNLVGPGYDMQAERQAPSP